MNCKNCGGQLPENAKFCPNCGTENGETVKMSIAGGERAVPSGFSSKKNILIIIIAAVLLIIGSVTVVAGVNYNSPSSRAERGIELAERYLNEQNYEQAIIEFQKVLEIEPMNVDAYLGLADTYEKMGDTDKATDILNEGLEKVNDERIQKNLDELLGQKEDNSENAESEPTEIESSSNDNFQPNNEYIWLIEPTYEYDDVEILNSYVSNPAMINDDWDYAYKFCYPSGEATLVDHRVPVDDGYDKYRYYEGTNLKGLFIVNNDGKKGLIYQNGVKILDNINELICNVNFLCVFNQTKDESYTFDNNFNLLDEYSPPYPAWLMDNIYGINTDKVYITDYSGAIESDMLIGSVVSAEVHPNDLYDTGEYFSYDKNATNAGKYGLANNGKLVVKCEFDGCLGDFVEHTTGVTVPLSDDNRIVFFKDNKIYVFDQNGKCYSDGIYDKVNNNNQELYYLNGYLPVCKDDRWGLIDVNGNEIISCQFEDITSVYDGKAWAKQNGKWGVVEIIK